MRFLVDECTGPAVARWLEERGHDVFSVYDDIRGAPDDVIIEKAHKEDRILISNDKDFGEKIFREHRPHKGVILLRLSDERSVNKIAVLNNFLQEYAEKINDKFIVITEEHIRFSGQH